MTPMRRFLGMMVFAGIGKKPHHLGPSDELSERKLAELYEQLGRVMVERDFLLRKSML